MARSLLQSFVSGTRGMLTAQLFVSVGAVALAGWTLGVTNELIRERDRLRERVIQLEESMAGRGIVVPSTPTVVEEAPPVDGADVYPGEVGAADPNAPIEVVEAPETPTQDTPSETPPGQTTPQRDFGQVIGDLIAPAPEMRTVVLHVRAREDQRVARLMADELSKQANVRVVLDVLSPRDQRQSGYAYFDGRQSRAAAALVTQFHEIARRNEVAPWSAQLRGVALPAQGEYTADRLDIVLPPLPPPTQVNPELRYQVNPEVLRNAPRPPG